MNALPGNLHMTDLMPSLLRDSTNFLHCVVLPHRSHPSNTIRAPRFAIADIWMFCLSIEIWRPVWMIFSPARRRLHSVSVAKFSSPKVLKSEGSQVRMFSSPKIIYQIAIIGCIRSYSLYIIIPYRY